MSENLAIIKRPAISLQMQEMAETVEFEEVRNESPLFIEANTQAITLHELKL